MKFYLGEIKIPVYKCKKPTMRFHRGRTWDHGTIKINGENVNAWLDTTWGFNTFFQWNNQWYKVQMFSEITQPFNYDIDPFSAKPTEIITK